jgi:hypothetical protein
MRLLKLLGYVAFGYLVYEFFQGLVYGPPASRGSQRRAAGSEDLHRAMNEDEGRMNLTGIGRGTTLRTEDASGTSSTRTVGRGVVPR